MILPAVFRDVSRRLDSVIDDPFANVQIDGTDNDDEGMESTGRVTWRTRITVSLVAGLITASYVLSGAVRVLGKLVRMVWQTSDIPSSFAAAADEQESNEDMIMAMTNRRKVNGEDSQASGPSDLAP